MTTHPQMSKPNPTLLLLTQIQDQRVLAKNHLRRPRYHLVLPRPPRTEPGHYPVPILLHRPVAPVLSIGKTNLQDPPGLELKPKNLEGSSLLCQVLVMIDYHLNAGLTRKRSSCRTKSLISKIYFFFPLTPKLFHFVSSLVFSLFRVG